MWWRVTLVRLLRLLAPATLVRALCRPPPYPPVPVAPYKMQATRWNDARAWETMWENARRAAEAGIRFHPNDVRMAWHYHHVTSLYRALFGAPRPAVVVWM